MDAILRFIQVQFLFYFIDALNPYLFSTYATLSSNMKMYWTQSMVSTMVCLYMWGNIVAEMRVLDFSDYTSYTTSPGLMNVFQTFTGYIVFDLSLYLRYRTAWPSANTYIVHHLVALTMMPCLLMNQLFPHTQIAQALLAEITSPFVNQLYFFKTAGMKGRLFRINGVLVVVVWFLFRVVNFAVIWARIYRNYDPALATPVYKLIAFFFAVVYYMQLHWFYKIVRGCVKELNGFAGPAQHDANRRRF